MHPAAYEWVAKHATTDPVSVLDIGGRDINGSPRALFPGATTYLVVDIEPGAGVDVVADAATWRSDRLFDVVVCTEVFEHTAVWPEICQAAYEQLTPGGMLIATMAGPGRAVHSAMDGGPMLWPGEHYANVEPDDLKDVLVGCGFTNVHVDQAGHDVRTVASTPKFHRGGLDPGAPGAAPGAERIRTLLAGETVLR